MLSNSRLRTPGVSLGVKASEGWEGFLLVLHFKCHGRKPVGIYFPPALPTPDCSDRAKRSIPPVTNEERKGVKS